jgi:hypothetical protein
MSFWIIQIGTFDYHDSILFFKVKSVASSDRKPCRQDRDQTTRFRIIQLETLYERKEPIVLYKVSGQRSRS